MNGAFSATKGLIEVSEFTFIHAADLHLGTPFRGLRSADRALAEAADKATFRAFDRILALAEESGSAFVLFAGDVFDTAERNLRAQLAFRDGLVRLHERSIRSFIVHGNHDPLDGTMARLTYPDSAHFFPAWGTNPQLVKLDGEPIAVVHGYSYPRREVKESLLSHYGARSEDDGLFRIGLMHGNVGGDPAHDNYAPCSLADLAATDFDYWALGHVHTHKVMQRSAPAVVYPGSSQGLSPRETGVHGCCRVTVRQGEPAVEFIATDSLRWHVLEQTINGMDDLDALRAALRAELEAARGAGTSAIIRIRLTGRGPLHDTLRKEEDLKALREDLCREGAGAPFAWVERLDAATALDVDLAARRTADDTLGDFLRFCDRARHDAGAQAELRGLLEELCGRKDLRGVIQPLGEDRILALLDQAELLGADLLLGDGA